MKKKLCAALTLLLAAVMLLCSCSASGTVGKGIVSKDEFIRILKSKDYSIYEEEDLHNLETYGEGALGAVEANKRVDQTYIYFLRLEMESDAAAKKVLENVLTYFDTDSAKKNTGVNFESWEIPGDGSYAFVCRSGSVLLFADGGDEGMSEAQALIKSLVK